MSGFYFPLVYYQFTILILTILFSSSVYWFLKRNNRFSLGLMLLTSIAPLVLLYIFCQLITAWLNYSEQTAHNSLFEYKDNGAPVINVIFASYFLSFGYFHAYIKKLKDKERAQKNLEDFGKK